MARVYEKFLKKRWDYVLSEPTTSGQIRQSSPTVKVISNYAYPMSREERYFEGWNIPNYHRRVKRGELMPHTSWKQFISTGTTSSEYFISLKYLNSCLNPTTWYSSNAAYCPFTRWKLVETDLAEYIPEKYDLYVQEAAAKIYSNGHDTLTFLAELADVRRLFLNTAETLLKLRFPKNWKSLSSEWLAARYGWRTLLYDIKDLHKAVKSLSQKCERTRYSEKSGNHYRTTKQGLVEQTFTHYKLQHITEDIVDVSLRGSVTADITIPKFQFNPFVTGWEVIPLSFVIDWFLSIGKSIAAASFLAIETSYSASCGYAIEVRRSYHTELINPTSQACAEIIHYQEGESTARLEVRTPCSVPISPHFALKLNPYKILDLIGLIIQRL